MKFESLSVTRHTKQYRVSFDDNSEFGHHGLSHKTGVVPLSFFFFFRSKLRVCFPNFGSLGENFQKLEGNTSRKKLV